MSKVQSDAETHGTTWPVVQPETPRSPQYFCSYFPCVLFVAPFAYALGFFGVLALLLVIATLYTCCGCPAFSAYLWTRSWAFWPWLWLSDLFPKLTYVAWQTLVVGLPMFSADEEGMPLAGLRPKGRLAKNAVDYALNIRVPSASEEEFYSVNADIFTLLSKLPMTDRFDGFAPDEDPISFVMKQVGSIYPPIYQNWGDKQSDEALTRFCLYGLGAHRVEVETSNGESFYVVRTNALSTLPVRTGFARYGGDAYFDMDWRPVKIVDAGVWPLKEDGPPDVVITRPGDARWHEAKFRFRSSLSVLVTLADHLYGIHLQVANLFVTAVRECLSPDHPMRRFLTPYTFQTIAVNERARAALIQPRTMAMRCFAFTDMGLQMAFAAAPSLLRSGQEVDAEQGGPMFNREEYYEHLKKQGIDTPYFRQSVAYWRITRKFVVSYMAYFYPTHAAVTEDIELLAMLRQFSYQVQFISSSELLLESSAAGTSALSMGCISTRRKTLVSDDLAVEALYERIVDSITNYIFTVTAGHEQAGAVEVYVQDVSFCAFKWVPGAVVGTKQTATAQAVLMSSTYTPMPKLLGSDWTHLFPAAQGPPDAQTPAESFRVYQEELLVFSDECQAYNNAAPTRNFPFNFPLYVFDPRILETSVSV